MMMMRIVLLFLMASEKRKDFSHQDKVDKVVSEDLVAILHPT
jgi:hypothetical protein